MKTKKQTGNIAAKNTTTKMNYTNWFRNKKYLGIGVISVVLIAVLISLVYLSPRFVGKAIQVGEAGILSVGQAGIIIGEGSTATPGSEIALPVYANFGNNFITTFSFRVNYFPQNDLDEVEDKPTLILNNRDFPGLILFKEETPVEGAGATIFVGVILPTPSEGAETRKLNGLARIGELHFKLRDNLVLPVRPLSIELANFEAYGPESQVNLISEELAGVSVEIVAACEEVAATCAVPGVQCVGDTAQPTAVLSCPAVRVVI